MSTEDTSTEVDDLHVKLPDGRVILKTKRCFRHRTGELLDGTKVELNLAGTVYKKEGGVLTRLTGKPKLSKAEKKAAKRGANKAREDARQAQAELEGVDNAAR